jgi:hypothetical protein
MLPVHQCDGDVTDRQYQLKDEDEPARHLRSIGSISMALLDHTFHSHTALV